MDRKDKRYAVHRQYTHGDHGQHAGQVDGVMAVRFLQSRELYQQMIRRTGLGRKQTSRRMTATDQKQTLKLLASTHYS